MTSTWIVFLANVLVFWQLPAQHAPTPAPASKVDKIDPGLYVNDSAGVISQETAAKLARDLRWFEFTNSITVKVVTVKPDAVPAVPLRTYVCKLAVDADVLLLIIPGDRSAICARQRITETIAGVGPTNVLKSTIDPLVKSGEPERAVVLGLKAILWSLDDSRKTLYFAGRRTRSRPVVFERSSQKKSPPRNSRRAVETMKIKRDDQRDRATSLFFSR